MSHDLDALWTEQVCKPKIPVTLPEPQYFGHKVHLSKLQQKAKYFTFSPNLHLSLFELLWQPCMISLLSSRHSFQNSLTSSSNSLFSYKTTSTAVSQRATKLLFLSKQNIFILKRFLLKLMISSDILYRCQGPKQFQNDGA